MLDICTKATLILRMFTNYITVQNSMSLLTSASYISNCKRFLSVKHSNSLLVYNMIGVSNDSILDPLTLLSLQMFL